MNSQNVYGLQLPNKSLIGQSHFMSGHNQGPVITSQVIHQSDVANSKVYYQRNEAPLQNSMNYMPQSNYYPTKQSVFI